MKISFWLSIGPSGDRYLTTGHQVAVWAKLPTVNWMVCLPSSQTLKHTQQHSIKNGRTSYETRRGKHKGVKEKASELKVPACHDLLSTSPISPAPCAQGALPVMGWQKGARCRLMHRWMVLLPPARKRSKHSSLCLGTSQGELWRELSHWVELWAVHPVIYFAWKK